MRKSKAKIICTLGPACQDEAVLARLVEAGMDVARLNFSHGTYDDHLKMIRKVRDISAKLGKPVGILQDLQGPKIRIGKFENPPILLNPGDLFTITVDQVTGNEHIVSTSYKNLPSDVQDDDFILLSDGLIKLKVMKRDERNIFCEVINGGNLYDRRGINLPGVRISEPSLTEKDKQDLEFGLENGIDFVALSFVRKSTDILQLKHFMGSKAVPVIAKLEKPEALNNLDGILEVTDAVMVARGDLGVEISAAKVPSVQKQIIERCQVMGKPVITATQMLETMINNPVPTRAEVSDVANAIFDGTDAVMLSGESAFGKYPVESVAMMRAIIEEAEEKDSYFRLANLERGQDKSNDFAKSVCHAAYYSAREINAKYIVVFTQSGYSAQLMSNFRSCVPVLALTTDPLVQRKLTLLWGVTPVLLEKTIANQDNLKDLQDFLMQGKWVETGDRFVLIMGSSLDSHGTNMLRLHRV